MDPKQQKAIIDLLVGIASSPKKSDFEPPKKVSKDSRTEYGKQKLKHRTYLLFLISGLSIASFVLLAFVVITQMQVRVLDPNYTGVSDSVMQILAVSVFGQVITVVATIVIHVWKDSD